MAVTLYNNNTWTWMGERGYEFWAGSNYIYAVLKIYGKCVSQDSNTNTSKVQFEVRTNTTNGSTFWSSGNSAKIFMNGNYNTPIATNSFNLYCHGGETTVVTSGVITVTHDTNGNYSGSAEGWLDAYPGVEPWTGNSGFNLPGLIPSYSLDLNGRLDGNDAGNIAGYGTVDVYINNEKKGTAVTDYYASHKKGSSYNITNINATVGHSYVGVYSGSTSGTLNANTGVRLEFKTNTYTITYDANGGTGAPATQSYTYASTGTVALSSTIPTRSFYDFAGWSYNGATYQPGDPFPKNLATNVTLTAVWTPKAPTNVRVVRTGRTGSSITVDILYDGGDITNIKLYYKKHIESKDRYVLMDLGIRNYATVVDLLMDTDYDFYAVVTNPGGMGISGL